MQDVFGGSSSSSQNSSQSGFALLPPEIQDAIKGLATEATSTLSPVSGKGADLFKLPSLSTGASSALDQIQNQNFSVTPESFRSDVAMQMDPYKDSVINQIQRTQNGALSQLNSYLTNSGTFGSNRGMLGASDISNAAADQVGSFLSGEYNTAANNALTTIPQNRAQSAQGAVSAGLTAQQQALQNQQAPVSALSKLAQIIGVLPQSGGSTSQGTSESSSSNGIIPTLFG